MSAQVDGKNLEDAVLAPLRGFVYERADETGGHAVALMTRVDFEAGEKGLAETMIDLDHADVCSAGGDESPARAWSLSSALQISARASSRPRGLAADACRWWRTGWSRLRDGRLTWELTES